MRKTSLHERTDSLAWEDLRTILAIVRAGSLSAAARALKLQHSTVFRRVEDIEKRLGTQLFERERGQYRANAHAELLAETGQDIEAAVLEAERRVLGADARLSGVIRIATSEALGSFLLPSLLKDFLDKHPQIELEVDVNNYPVDLGRREADLAVRATQDPPQQMLGRQLATLRYAVYLQRSRLEALGGSPSLDQLEWIGTSERVAHFAVARWSAANLPFARPRLRVDSMMTLLRAAGAGAGAAVLPTFAAAQCPGLVRLTEPIADLAMPIWVLSHPDTRGNARVRALVQHLAELAPARLADLEAGSACTASPLQCSAMRGKRQRDVRRKTKQPASNER